jgi:hypothetical protein
MSNVRKFWQDEMRSILTDAEYIELNHRMNRLLRKDIRTVGLNEYDELLAEYGLEPDYLLAWIG